MMKNLFKVFVLSLALLTTGCGIGDKIAANFTGDVETCYDGVIYMQFGKGVSVKYNQDGTIATCEE